MPIRFAALFASRRFLFPLLAAGAFLAAPLAGAQAQSIERLGDFSDWSAFKYEEGGNVVCAYHEATYDLATGALLFGPALEDIAVFPIHVAGDQLRIEWPEALPQDAVVPVDYEEGRLEREQMMM